MKEEIVDCDRKQYFVFSAVQIFFKNTVLLSGSNILIIQNVEWLLSSFFA